MKGVLQLVTKVLIVSLSSELLTSAFTFHSSSTHVQFVGYYGGVSV